jgi:hypothetical protein
MSLFPSYDNISDDKLLDQNSVATPLFHTIEYTLDTIVDKISNIDNLDESEIKSILVRQHSLILNYDLFLSSSKTRSFAQKLFSNKRFLKLFLNVVGLLNLSDHEIMCINKLAYDYYIIPNKDSEVSDLLLSICNNINNIDVIKLSSRLGITGARTLSMINKSSFQIEKRVHRINTFLVKCNIDLSAQDIIDIMCMLYDRFTQPIIYTMLESKPMNLSNDQSLKFDLISSAIITILDNLSSDNLKKVLYDYAFTLRLVKQGLPVRFSMKSIPNPRFQSIISEIELDPLDTLIIP